MSDWTKEPWKVGKTYRTHNAPTRFWESCMHSAEGCVGYAVGATQEEAEANAARITSCVNALAGFPNPEADVQALVEALDNVCNELESTIMSEFQTPRNPRPDLTNSVLQNAKKLLLRLRREP